MRYWIHIPEERLLERMYESLRMRILLGALCLAAMTTPAGAQGDAAAGRAVAERACGQCHDVNPGDRDNFRAAPTFQTVADDPAVTEPALRSFFEKPHVAVPNAQLTRRETEDVLTYILTLKRSRSRG